MDYKGKEKLLFEQIYFSNSFYYKDKSANDEQQSK